MTKPGDIGLLRPVGGERIFVPARRPVVGAKCLLYPITGGGRYAIPLDQVRPGDPTLIEPSSGGRIAVPLTVTIPPQNIPRQVDPSPIGYNQRNPIAAWPFIGWAGSSADPSEMVVRMKEGIQTILQLVIEGSSSSGVHCGAILDNRFVIYRGGGYNALWCKDLTNGSADDSAIIEDRPVTAWSADQGRVAYIGRIGMQDSIYVWTKATGQTETIAPFGLTSEYIDICGDLIIGAYRELNGVNMQIQVYRASTKELIYSIPGSPLKRVTTDGRYTAWDHETSTIEVWDSTNGVITYITGTAPSLSDGRLLYRNSEGIRLRTMSTGADNQICSTPGKQTFETDLNWPLATWSQTEESGGRIAIWWIKLE